MEKVRVNMYLPKDIKDYVNAKAEENGFNLTTMIQVMILDYRKQEQAMQMARIIDYLPERVSSVE